ncbi:MAG TPA: hypothetical protein EYG57_09120 [Planctomycetes bacterium]|nr:hypothetical protein [Planctomycetota bacterium]
MGDLQTVVGVLVFCLCIVGLAVLFSRKLGASEAKSEERQRALKIQERMAKILARSDRTRSQLVSWMRNKY